MPILSMFYIKRLENLHFVFIYYGVCKLITSNKRIDKYNKNRYGHIIVREIFASKSIYASIDLFPIEKEMREKKKANQETMININWKTLFCTIQRHIRRTVYQPHEP